MFGKKLFTGLAIMLLLGSPCMAASIEVSQNMVNANISVSGQLGTENSRRMLMLHCLKDGIEIGDIASEEESQQSTDAFSAVGYAMSDKNGAYAFPEIMINGDSGEYSFYVTVFNSDKVYSSEHVKLVTENYINEFISSVSETSGDAVYENIQKEIGAGLIELNIPLYDLLSTDGQKKAAEMLENTKIDSIADFCEKLNNACAKQGLDFAKDGESLDTLFFPEKSLAEYADVINSLSGADKYKSISCVKSLEKMDDDKRIAVMNSAIESGCKTRDELAEKIYISVINYEMNNCGGYGDISSVLEGYKDDVLKDLDYDAYKKSSFRSSLNKELLKKQFDSAEDLISYIEKYLKDAGNSGGSGGGGGGSSSSKGTVSSPVYVPNKNSTDNNKPQSGKFKDLSGFEWAQTAILYLSDRGIVSGKGNDCFDPQSNVTREEFVKMLVLSFSLYSDDAECSFEDVGDAAWYKPYVASAVKNGIVNGISPDSFGTGNNITRQDMAVCVYRAAGGSGDSEEAHFTDSAEIAPYAKDSINWMKEHGLISGYIDGSFAPHKYCTRAEAAKIIYEAINRVGR